MKLLLATVGRLKAGPERLLFERYHDRAAALARSAGISGVELVEVSEGRPSSGLERKREEATALAARMPEGRHLVLLDEGGISMTSTAFATLIGRRRDAAIPALVLAIGGPDGFDESFRRTADTRFAFGAATLPHQLVRVLAAEQIYRALTILTGHPYHRA